MAIGDINRVALTKISHKKRNGYFARTKKGGHSNKVTVLTA